MTTLSIDLPSGIDVCESDLKKMFAVKLYDEGILTAGKAAAMLGITKREFIETVGVYVDMTSEELQQDLDNARWATQYVEKKVLKEHRKNVAS
jgi:predicted HTH domain antitoxin